MTVFWLLLGFFVVFTVYTVRSAGRGKSVPRSSGGQKETLRVDHSHYLDSDDYECSACGARFRKKSMVCPRCGARFTGTKADDTEYDEELDEMLEWDEEDKEENL